MLPGPQLDWSSPRENGFRFSDIFIAFFFFCCYCQLNLAWPVRDRLNPHLSCKNCGHFQEVKLKKNNDTGREFMLLENRVLSCALGEPRVKPSEKSITFFIIPSRNHRARYFQAVLHGKSKLKSHLPLVFA